MNKFVYVFNTDDRDLLLSMGFTLLKDDVQKNVYVFENKDSLTFSKDVKKLYSDTLTF